MRNFNNITRLKRISVIVMACLLLALVAALLHPKRVALDAPPAAVPTEPEKIKTESLPQVGPDVAAATSTATTTAKPKQNIKSKPAATAQPAPIKQAPVFATQLEAKAYLKTLVVDERDYLILENIIQCESGWEQYWPAGSKRGTPGTVKISQGNIGFGQINRGAHEKKFIKLGIDIYSDKGNLDATVSLYKQQGVGPWKPWSGHCWLPKLKALGISV